MQRALEELRTAHAQQRLLIVDEQKGHDAKFAGLEKALENVSRDRESMRIEV